jgi:hypothetical protein
MVLKVFIGDFKIDLFPDENVELNSSIANVEDITKNTTEYTKGFSVPASEANNFIFKHYYDANIDNTFDARTSTKGRIELDGMPFKYGKFKLERVIVKNGNPSSYSINFTGNLVSLKDKVKNDFLSGLDFDYLNHLYNSTNVKQGLQTSLFNGKIIYTPLVKKQLFYNSNSTENTQTETRANIAFGAGSNTGIKYSELKPSIQLIEIIKAIEIKYGFTISRDFFGRNEFLQLYLYLNDTSERLGVQNEKLIDFTTGNADQLGFNFTTDTWNYTQSDANQKIYKIKIFPVALDIPYSIIAKNNGVEVARFTSLGGNFDSNFNLAGSPINFQFFVASSTTLDFSAQLFLSSVTETSPTGFKTANAPIQTILDTFIIKEDIPKIKVIDFLKGLFNAFKLVVIVNNEDDIYINTINDYYAQGKVWDLSKYVNNRNYEVEAGKILNEIKLKFQEPSTILNKQFTKNNGLPYGNEEIFLTDDNTPNGNPLDGGSFVIDLPFEQIVYEKLNDLNDNLPSQFVYGAIIDDTLAPASPKPHIYYRNNVNIINKPIAFLAELNVRSSLNTTINLASHSLGTDYGFIFSEEIDEFTNIAIQKNLYTNYYRNYINSIFNIKRRNFKYKGFLPLRILLQLQLNDVLQISNDFFRIDNYNVNLLTTEVTLNLINSFDNRLNGFVSDRTQINTDYTAKTESVYVTNLENFTFTSSDSFVTLNNVTNGIFTFNIAQNTGVFRIATLTITDTNSLQEIEITVSQSQDLNPITFSRVDIFFNNNTITFNTL